MRIALLFAILLVAANGDLDSMLKYYMYSLSTDCSTQQGLNSWSCSWCEFVPIPPVTDITIFETPDAGMSGTYGYVGRSNESILVAFRGSRTIENWILDAEFTQMNYTPVANALVHEGFYYAYEQVASTIIPAVKQLQVSYPDLPVISIGHSLGGALSVLNAAGLVQAGVKNVQIRNTGQPRVGNLVFAKYINEIIPTVYRVVNMADIVPHLPPQDLDYHHESVEVWFPTNHTSYVVCNSSGEDLKCSDSVDPTKYSIPDHTQYFGYGRTGKRPPNAC